MAPLSKKFDAWLGTARQGSMNRRRDGAAARGDQEQERRRHYEAPHDSHPRASAPSGECFAVPRTHELVQAERATLTQPREIAYFSKYAGDDVRFDRSNLLAYKEAEIGANLLDGFEDYTFKDETDPTAPPAPLAPLLAALDHFQGHGNSKSRPHFITYRNNLNKIMGTPYNAKSEWTFDVEKRKGCVYLDVRRTQEDIENSRSPHENQRRGAFAGRRFEIYSTHPKHPEQSESSAESAAKRTVNENEEFCSVSAMTLGDKRLVVAAEIDCFEAKGEGGEGESGASTAGTSQYVELKTFRLLQRPKDQFVFERFKLLAFWIQSYLVGTPRIVCGFRNENFEVCKLQSFRTTEIPNFCRKYWSPVVCLNFTKKLLDWIYASATEEGRVYRVTYLPRQHAVEMRACPASSDTSFLPESLRSVGQF